LLARVAGSMKGVRKSQAGAFNTPADTQEVVRNSAAGAVVIRTNRDLPIICDLVTLVVTWSRGHGHDRDIRHRRAAAGGGLAVARTLTKKGGASTASCQCGFEGGTRRHADLLDMCVISPPIRGTRSARRCRLRTPLGQELK
jgi:hypothetical protein